MAIEAELRRVLEEDDIPAFQEHQTQRFGVGALISSPFGRAKGCTVNSFLPCATSALVLLGAPATLAQVNVEPIRARLEATGTTFEARFGLVGRRGNTDGLEANGGFLIGFSHGPSLAYLNASGNYAEYDGERQVAKSFAHLRYNYRLCPRVAAEAFAQIENDEFRRLLARELLGIGPRFTLISSALVRLNYGTSVMFEWTQRDDAVPVSSRNVENVRWNNYIALTLVVQERITLTETAYYQPRFDDFGDFWFLNVTSARFQVTDVLASRIDFTLRREAEVPTGVDAVDIELSSSLELTF